MATRKSTGRKYSRGAGESVERAMHEFEEGTLKSGPKGRGGPVRSREQAIAIGLSEAREAGERVPPAPTGRKTAAKRAGAKKTGARKAGARTTAARKATTRKTAAKKSTARKSTARKSTARKSTAKKATARKSAARKTAARKAPGKRA